jgi:SET domain-containing protein
MLGVFSLLLCKTSLKASSIQGIGLFAEEVIPKGTVLWVYQEGLDLTFSEEELKSLSSPAVEQVMHHAYQCLESGNYILCGDNARFMNHSSSANTHSESNGLYQGQSVSSVDIAIGDEITCDYFEFDKDAYRKLTGREKR